VDLQDLMERLRCDRKFIENFTKDPFSVLSEVGIDIKLINPDVLRIIRIFGSPSELIKG